MILRKELPAIIPWEGEGGTLYFALREEPVSAELKEKKNHGIRIGGALFTTSTKASEKGERNRNLFPRSVPEGGLRVWKGV